MLEAIAKHTDIFMQQIGQAMDQLTNHLFIKTIVSALLTVFGFLFDLSQWELILAMTILVVLDWVTGIIASTRFEGDRFRSPRALEKPVRWTAYIVMVLAAHQLEVLMLQGADFVPVDETMLLFIGITEFISVLENFERMGYRTPRRLLEILQSKRDGL